MNRLLSIFLSIFIAVSSSFAAPVKEEARGTSTWYTAYSTKAEADKLLADYERAGMNTLFGQVFWNRPFYPTDLYEPAEFVGVDGFDPIRYLMDECVKRGWTFYAWFVNATIYSGDAEKYSDWLQTNADGEANDRKLCYNAPGVREREKAIMVDFFERYPDVHGFQFDYIRFPWRGDYSYSVDGRKAFEEDHGIDPLDFARHSERFDEEELQQWRATWDRWQRDNLNGFLRDVYKAVKEINPDILVGSAVMGPRSWMEHSRQNWPAWVEEGLLEFIKPMWYAYGNNYDRHRDFWIEATGEHFHRAVLPLGGSEDSYDGDMRKVAEAIESGRALGATGFFFFRYGSMSDELLDFLGETVFSEPAAPYRPEPRHTEVLGGQAGGRN